MFANNGEKLGNFLWVIFLVIVIGIFYTQGLNLNMIINFLTEISKLF